LLGYGIAKEGTLTGGVMALASTRQPLLSALNNMHYIRGIFSLHEQSNAIVGGKLALALLAISSIQTLTIGAESLSCERLGIMGFALLVFPFLIGFWMFAVGFWVYVLGKISLKFVRAWCIFVFYLAVTCSVIYVPYNFYLLRIEPAAPFFIPGTLSMAVACFWGVKRADAMLEYANA
jgi:hypothetical protein